MSLEVASGEISADWVWTGAGAPLPGLLRFADGRITEFEPGGRAPTHHGGLLVAGLVNAHVHLDLTFAPEGPQLQGRFTDWLLRIKELRDAEGPEGLTAAARDGIQRSLASGCTLLVDYDSGGYSLPALAASPIRRLILREVIRFHDDLDVTTELRDYIRDVAPNSSDRELRGIAPHAPYTVHPQLLPRLIELAGELEVPWSTHIAEQPWEEDFLCRGEGPFAEFFRGIGIDLERFGVRGETGARHLDRRQLLPGGWLVHGNYLHDDEVAAIAAAGASVVFCPRSHSWFDHAPYPLAALHDAGVPICWGTDGLVSNGELSVLAEMREVRRQFPAFSATEIFRSAITTPRRLLDNHFGHGDLRVGDPADFCVLPATGGNANGLLDEI
ncbi:MAG: amidohydrolase family protein, partial [Planctomycetota bacterium]